MTQTLPDDVATEPAAGPGAGIKGATLTVWILFALTLLTGGLSAIVGMVVAAVMRRRASGLDLEHINAQSRLFWSGLIWAALFTVAWLISLLLTTLYIGIPLVFLFWAALVLLGVWFTIRSVLGASARAANRAP